MQNDDRKRHWEDAWSKRAHHETSWYQDVPALSLEMIERAAVAADEAVIDIGGGASPLAGHLLEKGFSDVAVLDISAAAIVQARRGLGERAARIHWIEADVTCFEPDRRYGLWHDRAAFHFLTEATERRRYIDVLLSALRTGGQAIIATFAPGGPLKCSGLDIVQYDAVAIAAELGDTMALREECLEDHRTPSGGEQKFAYFRFQRLD